MVSQKYVHVLILGTCEWYLNYKKRSLKMELSYGSEDEEVEWFIIAKLLQSCLTLCDPIDNSLTGSPIPGILQARTLEWVAISFSNA